MPLYQESGSVLAIGLVLGCLSICKTLRKVLDTVREGRVSEGDLYCLAASPSAKIDVVRWDTSLVSWGRQLVGS